MEKKYEGFNMVTVEVKQTEIILDLLSNMVLKAAIAFCNKAEIQIYYINDDCSV